MCTHIAYMHCIWFWNAVSSFPDIFYLCAMIFEIWSQTQIVFLLIIKVPSQSAVRFFEISWYSDPCHYGLLVLSVVQRNPYALVYLSVTLKILHYCVQMCIKKKKWNVGKQFFKFCSLTDVFLNILGTSCLAFVLE